MLRQSVAWFLAQTYIAKSLVIYNDAPVPVTCDAPGVMVINSNVRERTLGHKRNMMLSLVSTPLAAHWDDDDWYFPWHLETQVRMLQESQKSLVQPWRSFIVSGEDGDLKLLGPSINKFDSNLVFDPEAFRKWGGYRLCDVGQSRRLLTVAKESKMLLRYKPPCGPTYAASEYDGMAHCRDRGQRDARTDFGSGSPLIPDSIAQKLTWIRNQARERLPAEMFGHFAAKCDAVLETIREPVAAA
jgi:hypothetical protein